MEKKNLMKDVNMNFEALKNISNLMNYSESQKAALVNRLIDNLGLSECLKIDYINPNKNLKTLTRLLEEHNAGISVKMANKKLLELDIIENLQRRVKRGIKNYKSLKKLKYGVNHRSPKCPNETQPLYFSDRFDELLKLILGQDK